MGPQSYSPKELSSAIRKNETGGRFFPRSSRKETQPCCDTEFSLSYAEQNPGEPTQTSDLQNREVINVHCFMPLSFRRLLQEPLETNPLPSVFHQHLLEHRGVWEVQFPESEAKWGEGGYAG